MKFHKQSINANDLIISFPSDYIPKRRNELMIGIFPIHMLPEMKR